MGGGPVSVRKGRRKDVDVHGQAYGPRSTACIYVGSWQMTGYYVSTESFCQCFQLDLMLHYTQF